MKSLKTVIVVFVSLILMLIISLNAISLATDSSSNPKYIGITELKSDGIGYAIGNPSSGGDKIWNLIEYQNATSNIYSENNIYCLKAGVGFQNVDKRATYDVFYDMKQEKEDIAKENEILRGLVEGTIELDDGTTISQYSAILAILDMFYYDGVSNEEYKENLLNAAGIYSSAYQYSLTNDDIEAVQQAALWYFTNYGENGNIYDKTGNSGWLYYTENKITYTTLSDLNRPEGQQRQVQAEVLYKYLIRIAKEKAPEYDNITNAQKAPIQIDTQELDYEIQGSRTIIGPIHITKNNIKAFDLEFITKINNAQTNDYILLNENKNQVSAGTTIEDLIGEDFYISLPLEQTIQKTISLEINIDYDKTNFTLWASNTNGDEQPVVIPEKEEISIPEKLEIEIPNLQGEYELELVKQDEISEAKLTGAIFSVNGQNKTATNSSGIVSLGTIQITNASTRDSYVIKEVTAPSGYNGFTGSIELNVAKKIENGRYVVDIANTTMVVKDSEGTEITENIPVTIDKTTGKITITVDNEKIAGEYGLEILKVDQENEEKVLEDARFKVTLADGTEKTERTNAEGKIEIEGIEITEEGTETIKIEEIEAPEGYNKIFNSVELEVTKGIQDGEYVVNNIELKNVEGTGLAEGKVNANLENGKITVTVPNKKIEGSYEIEIVKQDGVSGEKLSGAVFNVNNQDKTATNSSGILSLGTVEITDITRPDTYVIKETTGPNGYNKFDGSIELNVAKKLENGNYVVDTENTTMVVKDSTGTEITQNIPVTIDKTTQKITITVDNVKKEFDLSLRKYITKVNGETLTGSNTRIPNIDTTTLENGTTATYKHRKDPVKVETGNIVTYEITIYNEGEKEGRATKIVDQLPEGLKFSQVVSGNFELESYDEETNTVNLIRKAGNTDNLAKYTGGELDKETIEITCEVVEQPGEREKVLTNVAWIAEEYDAESNVTITNQEGLDRDSEPETEPSVNQTNMENYTGNNNQSNLADSNYYYKGQQDDDDFEKLILDKATGNYEIELVKQDGKTEEKLSGAVFNVNGEDKTATNASGIVNLGTFTITNIETPDTYVIKEITGPNGYNKFEGSIELSVAKKLENGNYVVDTENTTMVVKDSTGATITENVSVTLDVTTGKVTITVENEKIAGGYNLEILKVDQENEEKVLEGAEFKVRLADGTEKTERTNAEGKIEIEGIEITEEGTETIKIEEIEAPEGYNKIFNSVELEVTKGIQDGEYVVNNIELKNVEGTGLAEGKVNANLENGKITVTVPNKKIEGSYEIELVKQDGETGAKLTGAIFNVNGEDKEATNASGIVNLGTFGIANTEIPDTYVIKETTGPNGYNKFDGSIELSVAKKLDNGNYVIDAENTTMVVKDSEGTEITQNIPVTIDKTTGKITITVDNEKIEGNYVVEIVKKEQGTETVLPGAVFNVNGEDREATNANGILSLGTVEITDTTTLDTYTITETSAPEGYNKFEGSIELSVAKTIQNGVYVIDTENTTMVVKDSTGATITQNIPVTIDKTTGKITITVDNVKKEFDLALRKFIVAVSRDENIEEDEYLRNEDGSYSRAPVVDASILNTEDENGNLITTATYNHTKEPVEVRKGDTVIYTIRVYNESELSGYAEEITDYLPDELEFLPNHLINQQYEWTIEGNRVTTDYLSKEKETEERQNLIEAFDETRVNEEEPLYYKEVQIACKVKDNARSDWKITNLAQITEDADKNGDETDDRDSTPDGGFEEPEGEDRPTYKDDETGEYIPGQEDDDDFEKVIVKEFDLALRKFIIAVSNDQTIEEDEYLRNEDGSYTREPVVDTSLLNTEDEEGNLITTAIYNHTKEPVLVQKNDIVIYMLRVYNEGDIDGYAAEIKDHLPPYLEYVDGEFNDQYGWEVSEDGRTLTTRYLENSLINKPVINEEGAYELSYQEVPVMCRVIESAPTNENITNIADITEYQDDNHEEITDRDSESDNVELPNDENLPGYKDDETGEYIPGQQDDDDFEKVIVKEFDLALRKWVTEAIVIENGKETVTVTGHQPYDDPEEIVKVELHRKKLNQVTVKFRYSIRVTNEGDIPGYVKEITDYIPEGLRFDPADNPGWTDEGNNVISTRLPQDILLQPGEYTEVEVVLTWINNENNMGVMTNIAEISEDDNDYDLPDKDSTPDNQKEGEDDIDDAPVMISISTGATRTYFMLGGIVLITIAGGVFLIKKFVI